MNLSDKIKKYIGLVVPFTCCPIGEPIEECPFKTFWNETSKKREDRIENMPEADLDELQKYHDKCLRKKMELARKYPDDEKYTKANLKDNFKY